MRTLRRVASTVAAVALVAAVAPVVAAAPAPAPSGNVHVVAPAAGPGVDFTNLQTAVDAAASGDLLLVKAGSYAGFTITSKSLTVTADLGHAVDVGEITVDALAASQNVVLSGLNVDPNGGGTALWLTSNAGPVHVERCTLLGTGVPVFVPGHAVQVIQSTGATFTECTIAATTGNSGDAGVLSQGSDVAFFECTISAASQFSSAPGQAACSLIGGTIFASGTSFFGGPGGDGGVSGPFMICSDGGDGGPGLSLSGGLGADPVARIVDCTFVGGPGGASGGPTCFPGSAGPPTQIFSGSLTTIPVAARTYEVSSPIRSGVPATLSFHGVPDEFVFLIVSGGQTPQYVDLFKGVFAPASPYILVYVGQIPGSGDLTVNPTVNLDPSLQCAVLHEQPIYYQIATGWTLGSPRPSVILASSF